MSISMWIENQLLNKGLREALNKDQLDKLIPYLKWAIENTFYEFDLEMTEARWRWIPARSCLYILMWDNSGYYRHRSEIYRLIYQKCLENEIDWRTAEGFIVWPDEFFTKRFLTKWQVTEYLNWPD